jgi:hypothetical protein
MFIIRELGKPISLPPQGLSSAQCHGRIEGSPLQCFGKGNSGRRELLQLAGYLT